jgi:ring-1,2-phenylacetyl-CoA epoxidase subunit PaaE
MASSSQSAGKPGFRLPKRLNRRWNQTQRDLRFLISGLRGQRGPVVIPRSENEAMDQSWLEWIDIPEYEIQSTQMETGEAMSVFLSPLGSIQPHEAGQFLTLVLEDEDGEFRRAYSIVSPANTEGPLQLTVKALPGGRASDRALRALRPGQTIHALGPSGKFVWNSAEDSPRELTMYAGGSGITPLMSIITTALEQSSDTRIRLLFANQNEESIIFRERLTELRERFADRFCLDHMLENPPKGWSGLRGRPNAKAVNEWSRGPEHLSDASHHYLCGPAGMMEQVLEALHSQGTPELHLHRESFTSPQRVTDDTQEFERQICVIDNGEGEVRVVVEPGQTVLTAALNAGIDLPFSCTMGGCGACQVELLSGEVALEEPHCLSDHELASGLRLTCVGRPLTNLRIRKKAPTRA